MKPPLTHIRFHLSSALGDYAPDTPSALELSFPDREDHGDLALALALKLARPLKTAPRSIAEEIVSRINRHETCRSLFSDVRIAGPGFVNLFFSDRMIEYIVDHIRGAGRRFGASETLENRSYCIEFVSANPTGPLTIAHARQAAVGDSLSRIIEFCGGRAHREYYLNDRGVQMEILGRSVARRYRELEDGPAVGGDDSFPEEYYRGEYIRELAKLLHDAHKSELETLSDSVREERIRDLSADRLLEGIRRDLEDFRVAFDRFFSECSLDRDNSIESCLDDLEHKELTYIREGALWFRSTKFGDDKDRVLVKSDGSQTYLTADIAYHRNKLERGFERLIDILGPDHHGYIPRLKAAVASLGHDPEKLRVLIVQLTTLYRGSVQLRMSTRRGEFITLRQLIDEVGVDAARYFFASRKTDTHLDFDLELAKRQTPDNPVFYVQYAFARISSILRKARERGIEADPDRHPFRVDAINDPEKNLLKRLSRFPETVLDAARHLEPQRITSYLEETAGVFQKYYSQGNRVITGDVPGTLQRMIVCRCFQQTIHNALTLLGINAPERM